jgi:hypothetical protein
MEASSFDESNLVLNAPKGMEKDCTPLSVFRGNDDHGNRVVISCWKLTSDEVAELLKTGRLWLIINGETMPPVALTLNKPFR